MGLFGLLCPLMECKVDLFSPIYPGRSDKWKVEEVQVGWSGINQMNQRNQPAELDEPPESPERDEDMSLHKMSEVSEKASKKP